jgi:hypothetical protein
MARSSAWIVLTVSATIHLLTASVAAGGSSVLDAPMPFACAKRAAFHSLVAKLR